MGKVARSKVASRVQERLIDELIGISRGVIADGAVDESEAIFIAQWIESHREIANRWPVNVLCARLAEMLKDGVLSDAEQDELLETLKELTGERSPLEESNRSTTLPLCKPAPPVVFEGKEFCLTGRFVFGPMIDCEETILELGGEVAQSPGKEIDYLVIGELGSPDWVHTTFGRDIERAVELRAHGNPIRIVSEEHWVNHLA